MFLAGIFTTHISYIILIGVYVIGYISYSKTNDEEIASCQEIRTNDFSNEDCNSVIDDSNDFYWGIDVIDSEKLVKSIFPIANQINILVDQKLNRHNFYTSNIYSRPPPALYI